MFVFEVARFSVLLFCGWLGFGLKAVVGCLGSFSPFAAVPSILAVVIVERAKEESKTAP